ncbi:PadR family transcriptional regulator [Fulvivirgaceae bacterium BMA10]|uniref:PadR family transcriptional regulator n=1 Tax=Splendidivirga corallicola TaxID=3051826 RepID=A0ABT8KP26_9BACT|nr:PadR family transcriptional regulator [Fulvivirgaceae bacterium BMA10]
MYSSQLLKGTYQTIILKLLSEHDRMYGYEISQKVKELSKGDIQLPEGSLYPILHKMQEEGLVQMERVSIGKRVRRYYSITRAGHQSSKEKLQEFENFVRTMRLLLSPKTSMS